MTQERIELYREFRKKWRVTKLRSMSIEDYTNLSQTSFTYDIEHTMEALGSIRGNFSFIYGVYRRENTEFKQSNNIRTYTHDYAWCTRYGSTHEEAFKTVKENIVKVVEAASINDMESIEAIDLPDLFKWKLAFHYMDITNPRIIGVFKLQSLCSYLESCGISTEGMCRCEIYDAIIENENVKTLSDVLTTSDNVWTSYSQLQAV